MQLTIDLGNDYTPEALREHVVRQAAHNMIHDYEGAIRYELEKTLREMVTTTMRERLDAEVDRVIRETIDGAVQPTDEFGQAKGPPTTLRGLVIDHARSWLDDKVNEGGDRSQYGKKSRIAFLVDRYVQDAMTGALKKEVDALIGEVRKGLTDRIGAEVSKTVGRVLSLPS